jgi:hypothetical protein
MKNSILIGVGGTGQTVIAAYLRLAELAGFTPAPFYVVDSDRLGPLSGTLTRLKSRIKKTVGGEMPYRFMIDPFPTADAERRTFGALFGNLTGDRKELFNCLFSEEAEFTPIRTGMYGRPSIGATSIRYKLLKNDDDLEEMKNTLRGGEKQIILVGSCFGGTGSGGVPMLANEFANLNQQEGYSLTVDAITFLPWFRLVLPPGQMRRDEKSLHVRLNDNFEPNAAAGIFYFKDKIRELVNTLIMIGVRDPGLVRRESNESQQEETAHILNVLAAILIQNHFTGNLKPSKGIAAYWYDETEGINSRNLLIHRDPNSSPILLADVIKRTIVRKEWLEKLKIFFENFKKIYKFNKPIFIKLALEKLIGNLKAEEQALKEISEHISKSQEMVNEGEAWFDKMNDDIFFRLKPEDKRVWSEDYEYALDDPLSLIKEWCEQKELAVQFEDSDFNTSEAFCDRFNDLFFDYLLTKEFRF